MISACRRIQLTSHSKFPFKRSCGAGTPTSFTMYLSTEKRDWNGIYSEENKSRTVEVLSIDRDNSSFKNYMTDGVKPAAVLVPFCYDIKGQPGLLCNLRSQTLNSHKGEISFPGGTFEPQDNNDPVTAALRETEEELGITSDEVDVWTTCRPFPTVSTRMGVIPVVGFIKSGPVDVTRLKINPDEVDHAFVIPLEHFCNPANWTEMVPTKRLGSATFTLPTYQNMEIVSEKLEGIQLWGLTAFVSHLVLSAFIPDRYTRKVQYISLMKQAKKATSEKNREQDKAKHSPISKL